MRIIQLHSENIKRVKVVDIIPDDNVIVLSGKNSEGKTSVLDSIWFAIQYRAASKGNPSPLRRGTDKGVVTVDLGEYIVTRRFTKSGTTLEVSTPDGSTIRSPQKLLDGLIGDLSFDPWEFSRKSEKDQREMLADVLYAITEGELDLAAFEARHKVAFESRSEINREKKRLSALITQMAPPTGQDPNEEISITDLTQAITDGMNIRNEAQVLADQEVEIRNKIRNFKNEILLLEKEHERIVEAFKEVPDVPNIDDLQTELANVEQTNKRAREVISYNKIRKSLTSVEAEVKGYNDAMELIEIEKAEALEASPLPVERLKVLPDGIMVLNEEDELVPFIQASAAQRLKISLGIAMAANPKLRVIRISDGSLLDDESMDIVRSMADEEDFQVWIEFASRNDQDRIGVYIEDGSVAEILP